MKVEGEPRHLPVDTVEQELEAQWSCIEACRRGDTNAWRRLHTEYFDFIHRMARRLGTPPAEVDDVCQETFVVAFRKLSSFREGRLTTWLYRIVANIVSGRIRRHRVRQALVGWWGSHGEAPMNDFTPEAAMESAQAERQVARLLAQLAPKKREVFVLFELEGISGERIAELVGCSVPTVWTRLHYARKEFEALARAEGFET